jgi:DNA-binding NtrC family response regulator
MKPNILIVDDEAPIRMLLQAFFRRRGYEVSVAATAKETLGVLDEVPIQVIILDIALEDADGLELLGVIKQAHPEIPVIMLTGMVFD